MDKTTLPPEATSITKELVAEILKCSEKCDDFLFTNYEVELANPTGKNFICIVFRVKVYLTIEKREEQRNFIIKIVPVNPMNYKFAVEENKIVQKERDAYLTFIPKLEEMFKPLVISLPKFYLSQINDETGIIALEDLCACGYTMADIKKGFDFDHCKLVMEEIGKFHAMSFCVKDGNVNNLTDAFGDIGRESNFTEYVRGVFACVLQEGVKSAFELVKQAVLEDEVSKACDTFSKMDIFQLLIDTVKPSEPFAVLCHGDFWGNNMMFKYKTKDGTARPISYKMFDLQFVRYALPTADLVWFIYTSTTWELRQNHLHDLLKIYHNSFTNVLQSFNKSDHGFTYEVLMELFKKSSLGGVAFATFVLSSVLAGDDDNLVINDAQTDEDYKNLSQEMESKFRQMAKNNPNIVERIHGIILDVIDRKLL